MSFRVGEKIVCVKTPPRVAGEHPDVSYPKKDCIYTIREFAEASLNGVIMIRLAEIVNPRRVYQTDSGILHLEQAFESHYFRPIDYSVGEKICEEITKICETETKPNEYATVK